MNRLYIKSRDTAQKTVEGLYKDLERRIIASPPGQCPVDLASAFLKLCHSQSCGKCTPCRVGLGRRACAACAGENSGLFRHRGIR